MCVSHSTDDLPEEEARLLFADVVVLDVIVQLAAVGQLHYHEDIVCSVKHLVELYDVLVAYEL